jgi:hypothetical protein
MPSALILRAMSATDQPAGCSRQHTKGQTVGQSDEAAAANLMRGMVCLLTNGLKVHCWSTQHMIIEQHRSESRPGSALDWPQYSCQQLAAYMQCTHAKLA